MAVEKAGNKAKIKEKERLKGIVENFLYIPNLTVHQIADAAKVSIEFVEQLKKEKKGEKLTMCFSCSKQVND